MGNANKQIMDGCTAAAHVAFALSDVATVYPITPIASMGQTAGQWGLQGRKNLMGQALDVREMESELGAAGATHGALSAGALATTFTASQGLLLMIPNMFKIAGELLPGVFHVGTRSIATHALSIFGDHQDIMACRSTGFAFLASASVQETMDLALVSHLAAIDGSVPVVHFFDGWRTSNEMNTIEVIDYESMRPLVNWDKVNEFRRNAMNPEHPDLRGSAQNPDVYFQNREAANRYYDAFPSIVSAAMERVGQLTGRHYRLFDYVGEPDAESVIVAMGSGCEVIEDTVNYLNRNGYKCGVVKVRLFRPFSPQDMLAVIPPTVKRIAVLDRTKEPGAQGEPLYQDVVTAVHTAGRDISVIGGRYGLSSKEFDPAMVKAVFDELGSPSPRRVFTVGINDDVTHLSLNIGEEIDVKAADITECLFYGIGADGTVGATKQLASIISDTAGLYAQAYFQYSAKKSGGYTVSQLRFGHEPIHAAYGITHAGYLGCNKANYVKRFPLADSIKEGGTLVINAPWKDIPSLEKELPPEMRRKIASKKIRLYTIDAVKIAQGEGLGERVNMVMTTVFLHLCPSLDFDRGFNRLKELISTTYAHEGNDVVNRNLAAIEKAIPSLVKIDYPATWIDATDETPKTDPEHLPEFVAKVAVPCNRLEGNTLPVSLFAPDGKMPMGTTAYEKRRIAVNIPQWNVDNCVECTECSLCCPHAAIRPVLMDAAEKAAAPSGFTSKAAHGKALAGYEFRIQVYPEDCVGCGSCATICPGHALTMVPLETQLEEQIPLLDYARRHVTIKDNLISRFTINGSQLREPMLEFSGACAGCGETPYVKLLTQLFGDRMLIANATGCSSIWGANFPSNAYCTDRHGHGPAWGNSLFEDNAEYGYGMTAAVQQRRAHLVSLAHQLSATPDCPVTLKNALSAWLDVIDDLEKSPLASAVLKQELGKSTSPLATEMLKASDMLTAKTVWAIGGDGWAYDIGFAGLDHVLASGQDINILVMDTECYSNTGGQTSKATPLGAVAKYSPDGKRTYKKDLGRMMMTYGTVYVASVALGANYQQAIDALREAQEFHGPSIVIAYCPCINHGIRSGMSHSIVEERNAVKCGYWPLYRYNPSLSAQGKNPLTIDCATPDGQLVTFINGEDRYADLKMTDPTEASYLQPRLQERATHVYNLLQYQAQEK